MEIIRVKVRLYGILTELAGRMEFTVELPREADLKSLLNKVFDLHPKIREFASKYEVIILRNGVSLTELEGVTLSESDRVELLPPPSGG